MVFLAHNGPSGLGDKKDSIWGIIKKIAESGLNTNWRFGGAVIQGISKKCQVLK